MGKRSTLGEQLKRLRAQLGGGVTLNELIERGVPKGRPREGFLDDSMIYLYIKVEAAKAHGMGLTEACKAIANFENKKGLGWQVIYKRHRKASKYMTHPDHQQHLNIVIERTLLRNRKLAKHLRK